MTAPQLILVINAGSSSLKYSLVDLTTGQQPASGAVERIGGAASLSHVNDGSRHEEHVDSPSHGAALAAVLGAFGRHGPSLEPADLTAVGHRVVHGGDRFVDPVLIDAEVMAAIEDLSPLAPLHNPAALAGIRAAQRVFADAPQVAVFDTAFHRTLPPEAYTYAVPEDWRTMYGVRRYGFHGTSFAYVSRRTAELLRQPVEQLDQLVFHLGNGASACALHRGRSVETSMGISTVEGLVMGTRPGDLDPALAGYLSRVADVTAPEFDDTITRRSGLLGLCGVSDFREIEARRARGDSAAALAYDVTVHRLVTYVGAYAAVLGRLDALTFTGGIGENSVGLRAAVVDRLGILGLVLDHEANAATGADRVVSGPASRAAVCVVATDEELEIARQSAALVAGS